MSRPVSVDPRLRLPARIRTRPGADAGRDCRLALADRLGALPGLRPVDATDDRLAGVVSLCVEATPDLRLLCRITRDGLEVFGLGDWDRHQVLASGWGRLQRDHVLLHLPRDEQELDVCWRIVRQAYNACTGTAAVTRAARAASPWDLPRFSRTSLQ